MKTKRVKTAVRKEEILRAALPLAVRYGYQNVTRVIIADFMGIGGTTVQYHFGTMKQLRSELMRYAVKQRNAAVVAQGLANKDQHAMKADDALKMEAAGALVS